MNFCRLKHNMLNSSAIAFRICLYDLISFSKSWVQKMSESIQSFANLIPHEIQLFAFVKPGVPYPFTFLFQSAGSPIRSQNVA